MIGKVPEIAVCYYMNGDYDFLLIIYARDADDLEKIHSSIKDFKGVSRTKTYAVLKSLKGE